LEKTYCAGRPFHVQLADETAMFPAA